MKRSLLFDALIILIKMKLSVIVSLLAVVATEATYRGHSSKNVADDRRNLQSKDSGSMSMSGSSGSGDSCADDRTLPDEQPASDCDICALNDVKPRTFYFKYNAGQGTTSDYQTTGPGCKASCSADTVYPASTDIVIKDKDGEEIKSISVSDGSTFSFDTSSSEAHIDFHDANLDCFFHTSCSQPMVPGDAFGPFELLPDEFCGPTAAPVPPPCGAATECVICGDLDENGEKNKDRPPSLTLQYNPVGQNSDYDQNEKDTVCTAGIYPSSTTLTVAGVNIQVSAGTQFTIFPPAGEERFDADTMFEFNNGDHDSCSIHTSCSKMLVQGDQIGPFIVLEGGECKEAEPCECISTTKDNYDCGEAITVSWDFDYADADDEPLADDWIGIYPCGILPQCLPEPIVWQYTCGDDPGCISSVNVGDLVKGSYTFDHLPASNQFYNYHKWPVTQWIPEDSNGQLSNCFQAYLVRSEAPSPPPYCYVCVSEPFTIGGSVEYECAPTAGTPGGATGGNNVPGVCQVEEGEEIPDVCNEGYARKFV